MFCNLPDDVLRLIVDNADFKSKALIRLMNTRFSELMDGRTMVEKYINYHKNGLVDEFYYFWMASIILQL